MTTPADRIDTTQESKATKALVFALLGFIPGWGILFAPFGWWLGRKELRLIKQGTRNPDGYTKANTARILGIVATIIGILGIAAAIIVTPLASQHAEQQAQQQTQLQAELDELAQNVQIPPGWEVEIRTRTRPDGRAYRASPDLSDSGTWLIISITIGNQEDEFGQFVNEVETSDRHPDDIITHETTTRDGYNGHLYEVTGMAGRTTGQPLGAYGARYYGPQRTYEVLAQYEIPDKDTVGDIWTRAVPNLTLP
jgi:hypothetical protein